VRGSRPQRTPWPRGAPCVTVPRSAPRSPPLSQDPKAQDLQADPQTADAFVPELDAIDAAAPEAAPDDLASEPERSGPQTAADFPERNLDGGDLDTLTNVILKQLDDDQAQDVMVIDLQGKNPLTDVLVIASGRSQRHVSAVADHLLRALKDNGFGRAAVEGLPQADWVLVDAGDVIVHLFRPEVRAFYQIERIWSAEAPAAVI
jgi:ribosome-associated protein